MLTNSPTTKSVGLAGALVDESMMKATQVMVRTNRIRGSSTRQTHNIMVGLLHPGQHAWVILSASLSEDSWVRLYAQHAWRTILYLKRKFINPIPCLNIWHRIIVSPV